MNKFDQFQQICSVFLASVVDALSNDNFSKQIQKIKNGVKSQKNKREKYVDKNDDNDDDNQPVVGEMSDKNLN